MWVPEITEEKLTNEMIGKFLIIDGSNLLFQMFFGMPARIVNQSGKAIQGTLGFVGALLKIIRMVSPTHVAVIFDGQHENERSSLDADYKANRPDYSHVSEEENPFSQLADVYVALDYMGIKHVETSDGETDDVIAAYALTYGKEMEIVISSFDSDFFQLVSDRVSVLRYRGEKTILCTPEYIKEKYDITPGQYADFKSLTGDSADNIKGAEKVGPKTAAALIKEFSTLENILANAERIKKPSVRESIQKSADRVQINYQLIKLDNHVQLPFEIKKLEYSDTGITTNEILKRIGLR